MQTRALLAFVLAAVSAGVVAVPAEKAKRASCSVSSVDDASDLSDCSSVTINAFTVASGDTLTISAASGATITLAGDVTFAKSSAEGPLITIDTDVSMFLRVVASPYLLRHQDVTFNGAGHVIDGNGAEYWDGEGTNGGVDKPHPFVKFKGYGTFSDFTVKNSPAQAISVGTTGGSAVFDSVTVDNSAGDDGDLGHNTDGFDVSADDVTIQNSKVMNQDDCVAINKGTNLVFKDNTCSGGHGISIGSISDDKVVSGVTISGNTVTDSMYGMRIKVKTDATGSVSDVTYSGNTISANDKYGFLISQSYSDDFGTPGTDSTVSGINFTGDKTTVTTTGDYPVVGVDCGHCTGTWDWSSLVASGGEASNLVLDDATISGGTY
ncbi:unnamed protein product [Peniophora sp. CBMAI 1063]|nr:unnamed protein product [Peniophora sp. CBMAI 1063]